MIYEKVKKALDSGAFVDNASLGFIPTIDDRSAWKGISKEAKSSFLSEGERLLSSSPAPLTASLLAEFYVKGLRKNHGASYFSRRTSLYALTVCECIENRGRFIDKIIDYIWAICEETTWVIPAHMHQNPFASGKPEPLPDTEISNKYIDLFSAETASVLNWSAYLLKDRLGKFPQVNERINFEIGRRILDNLENIKLMHWSGFVKGKKLNNWTPWICSNLIAVALLCEENQAKRAEWLLLLSQSLDAFLSTYAADGGCDEGPGYFNRAGGSALDCLELLYLASGGQVDLFGEPLIKSMASYIMNAHISGEYYINFADAACRLRPDATQLMRVGRLMKDDALYSYMKQLYDSGLGLPEHLIGYDGIFRRLMNLTSPKVEPYGAIKPSVPASHYFAGIQVFAARESAENGLYMAIKGGNNGESHNHNDIGNYIIYLSGEPFIVDAGVETYSRKTFSAERYEIWTMQSRYHNTAIIGGKDQSAGIKYAARDASCSDDGLTASFSCDIAPAYELNYKASYKRTLALNRKKSEIRLYDEILLEKPDTIALPLLLAVKPNISNGEIVLKGNKTSLKISFDPSALCATFEEIPLEDENLRKNWQRNNLYRLSLESACKMEKGMIELVFSEITD